MTLSPAATGMPSIAVIVRSSKSGSRSAPAPLSAARSTTSKVRDARARRRRRAARRWRRQAASTRRPRSSRRRRSPVGIGAGAPMIRSSMPSPLTSPAPATEQPLRSYVVDPVEAEAVACRRARRDRGSPRSRRRSRTPRSSRRRRPAAGIGAGAPTIRSSMPSPLTSPAPATEKPLWSYVVDPVEAEAVAAVERGEIEARREAGGGAEHHIALAGVVPAAGIGAGAPMIRSSMPSPLTSPAPATERRCGHTSSIPSRRKPLRAVERGEIEARREAGGGAEHHVALAGIVPAAGIGARRPDDQVIDAVAVDVPRARDRAAAVVIRRRSRRGGSRCCRRARRDRGSPRSRRRSRTPRSSRRRRTCRRDRRRAPR